MIKTNNLKITAITPVIAPAELRQVFPISDRDREFVQNSREQVKRILRREDHRIMAIVGPCSIHDTDAAIEYARKLKQLSARVNDQMLLIMRAYLKNPHHHRMERADQ